MLKYNNIDGFAAMGIISRGNNLFVHHNSIRHSNRLGYGYGVNFASSKPLIEFTKFDHTRHSIATDGVIPSEYEARNNIFGPNRQH